MAPSVSKTGTLDPFEKSKGLLYDLYMVQNKPLRTVSQYMREHHGLNGTDRQYKSRFKNWGWDNKKLRSEDYRAMYVVQRAYGRDIKFGVSTHNSNMERVLTEEAIKKELNRHESVSYPTLDQAWEILARRPARVISPVGRTLVYPGYPESLELGEEIDCSRLGVNDAADDNTMVELTPKYDWQFTERDVISDLTDSYLRMEQDNVKVMQNRNFITHMPRYLSMQPGQTVRQAWLTPHLWIYEAEVFSTIIPHDAVGLNPYEKWPILTIDMRDPRRETLSDEKYVWEGLVRPVEGGLEAFVVDKHQHTLEADTLNHSLRIQLNRMYTADATGPHKELATAHASYYIGQCLAGHHSLDPISSPDRHEARVRFAIMLVSNNPYILTEVQSMIVILASHDKAGLVAAYLQDCHEVAESQNAHYNMYLRTTIRHATAHHAYSGLKASSWYSRGQDTYLSALQCRHMQRRYEFERLMQCLTSRKQDYTLTYTLLRLQYAWALIDEDNDPTQDLASRKVRYDTSLSILLDCSERLRHQLGDRHVIRINCLNATARVYERLNNINLSIVHIREAIFKMAPTTNVLQAYRHRLYARLANLWARQARLDLAAQLYQIVVEFRIARFGYFARQTWSSVLAYYMILGQIGHTEAAQDLRRRATLGWRASAREDNPVFPVSY